MGSAQSDDDLDLLELLANLFFTIWKNIIVIAIMMAIGIAAGFFYYKTGTKVYSSRIQYSSTMPESYNRTQIEKLQKLIGEKNPLLTTAMHLSNEECSKLKKVKIESTSIRKIEIQKKDSKETNEETYVLLQVQSEDNTLWPQYTNGIIAFLEDNPFVKSKVAQQKKYYSELVSSISKEIQDLNDLKTKILRGPVTSSGKDGMLLMDPSLISTAIIDLTKEKIEYQNKLEVVNSIQIVEGFTVFENPSSPNFLICMIGGILLGGLLSITIIVAKAVRQRTLTLEKEN